MSKTFVLNKSSLTNLLNQGMVVANQYVILLFVLLLLGVYGFILFHIYTAHNAQPTDAAITSGVQSSANLHVDQTVVDEMQSLQDHSVNVNTLFEQARVNPFKE